MSHLKKYFDQSPSGDKLLETLKTGGDLGSLTKEESSDIPEHATFDHVAYACHRDALINELHHLNLAIRDLIDVIKDSTNSDKE